MGEPPRSCTAQILLQGGWTSREGESGEACEEAHYSSSCLLVVGTEPLNPYAPLLSYIPTELHPQPECSNFDLGFVCLFCFEVLKAYFMARSSAYMPAYVSHICSAHRVQKRLYDSPKLELLMVVKSTKPRSSGRATRALNH